LADFIQISMEYLSVALLVGAFLATASVVFGAKYKQGKDKARQLNSLLTIVIKAAEDDNVTEKEFQKIVASIKALLDNSEGGDSG